MQHYRIYSMDQVGHIAFAQDVQCETDSEALAHAKGQAEPYGVEVWRGAHLVARIEPEKADPISATGERAI